MVSAILAVQEYAVRSHGTQQISASRRRTSESWRWYPRWYPAIRQFFGCTADGCRTHLNAMQTEMQGQSTTSGNLVEGTLPVQVSAIQSTSDGRNMSNSPETRSATGRARLATLLHTLVFSDGLCATFHQLVIAVELP
jgi:hypothetical protein